MAVGEAPTGIGAKCGQAIPRKDAETLLQGDALVGYAIPEK